LSLSDKKADLTKSEDSNLIDESPNEIQEIPLELIKPDPDQPRKNFDEDEIKELAASIESVGLQSPILVRPFGNGTYQIVYGERRYRAFILLGKVTIPCIVKNVDDREKIHIQLIENLARVDLNPIEEACTIKRLISDVGYTHDKIAKMLGKSRSYVSNKLRLLNSPETLQAALEKGVLTESHARVMLSAEPESRVQILRKVIEEKMTVRDTKKYVQESRNVSRETIEGSQGRNSDVDVRTLKIADLLFQNGEFQRYTHKLLLISVMIEDLKYLRGL